MAVESNVVLVPLDSTSAHSQAVLAYCLDNLIAPTDKVVVLHVAQHSLESSVDDTYEQSELQEIAEKLKAMATTILKTRSIANSVSVSVAYGEPRGVIMIEANELSPRLIVMGSHGKGARPCLGSVTSHVLHRAECPVMIVPNQFATQAATTKRTGATYEINVEA
ncbi:uncharacterized protein BJ171DRAFT_485770 [Polychytrium aggregatum]|uniref:uncharacterized protein n=1 Tax=Polychytrium aggregatum TaxID=110093 RepID=UPI0022FE0284|nr:uncharacterized protein BJ171DRAFT_485770 [Polychytrium aggregatum]KAI9209215.1 hypothetical protein BJ171DRAFT_485770 [Polychytrium aggregatum]